MLGSVFKAISNISEGMKTAKNVLDGVSKAGKLFNGALDTTKFFGFAKWALIIAGVALALGYLIDKINIFLVTLKNAFNYTNFIKRGELC